MRNIDTGRGVSKTRLSPEQIAEKRSEMLINQNDHDLFLNTYGRIRKLAPILARFPMELDAVCDLANGIPVMEAAVIEALASLRAEGVRL